LEAVSLYLSLRHLRNEVHEEHGLRTFCASVQRVEATIAHSESVFERCVFAHEAPRAWRPQAAPGP
jgi:hypothetical protein